jgi:hypothetical protein
MLTKEEIIEKLSEIPITFVYEFIFPNEPGEPSHHKYYVINPHYQKIVEVKSPDRSIISSNILGLINEKDEANKQYWIDFLKLKSDEIWIQEDHPSSLSIEEEVNKLSRFGQEMLSKLLEAIAL